MMSETMEQYEERRRREEIEMGRDPHYWVGYLRCAAGSAHETLGRKTAPQLAVEDARETLQDAMNAFDYSPLASSLRRARENITTTNGKG